MAMCEAQIIWKWGGNGMRRYEGMCEVLKYWGRYVKGEESEINPDYRNSFMEAFYSFLPSALQCASFRVRHE